MENEPAILPAREKQEVVEKGREKINILSRSEIFLGLSDEALGRLVAEVASAIKTFEAGAVLFETGDLAPELFIVEEGQVDLIISHLLPKMERNIRATIDTVCTGGTFGWSALIAPYTYTVSARCTETAKVLALNGRELMRFLDRETEIGYEVMKTLNHIIGMRLRDSNRALFNIIASGIRI